MLKNYLQKFSLSQALIIMIAISFLLPIPVLMGTYVHSAYKTKQETLAIINTKKFKLSSEIFAESLWNYYPELGQKMIEQLLLDQSIVFIAIEDTNDKVFLHWKSKENVSDNDVLFLQQPLEKNGNIIGSLEMHFKKQGIIDSFISDFFLFGTIFALQFIFLALIISFVYYQKIINPIKRLMQHSKLLSEQKLDESFDWDSHDEIGTLGVAMDQTRIKLKELFDNLKKENETLDEKVKQRTQELEDASRYKSEFLANMSHEIRTPMNAIMGMSHLMSKTAMNQTQAGYIAKIKEASSVLLHIINDVLDFSKIEAGKMQIESIAFDLHKELKKSCSIFSVLAKEKNIEFKCDYVQTHRFFRGDPYKIMQIVNNFLSNAIKFTTQGLVTLSVKESLSDDGKTSSIVFSVIDSGVGIPKEKQKLLFKAFCQLDASITRKHGGTGLGLYICTQLASMMQGNIGIESEEGQGSSFSLEISLPVVQGLDIHKEDTINNFEPLNLLVISDDVSQRTTLDNYIRSFGFFATCKTSSDNILADIDCFPKPYNLLIIDKELSNQDGMVLYENLRAHVSSEKMPSVLMISKSDEAELKSTLFGIGIKSLLHKPINPSMLYDEITSLCEVSNNQSLFDPSLIDLSQKKILVVEDNDINLEVATYLLKDTHAKISIAKNGLEAVDKVSNEPFDLILMDIQMPLMDGYEATRIIRKQLKVTTPIVAMTANVMAQDIEKCMQAGMNFHVGKPFEVEDFYGTLLEALHVSLSSMKKNDTEKRVLRFDKGEAIRKLGGNEALWEKTFCGFYEHYLGLPHVIKNLLHESSRTTLIDYVHTLKGLCGTVGAFALAQESAKVESLLKEKNSLERLDLMPLLSEHKELFTLLIPVYEKIEPILANVQFKDENKEEIVKFLSDLELSLESSNVSRVNLALDNLALFDPIANHLEFKSIVLSCSMFDFETALIALKSLEQEFKNV